jgi:3-polyprenyl-4-hydroxybenzoate decarboxylase and related decarboxylases
MNLRSAIKEINPIILDVNLEHDKVVDFLKDQGLLNTPLILRVEGKKVAMNFLSSREILARFLNADPKKIAVELAKIYEKPEKLDFRNFEEIGLKKFPKNLYELPILKFFPKTARYITAGIVIAKREHYNASFHRMMLIDERRLAVRLVAPRHTYLMWGIL